MQYTEHVYTPLEELHRCECTSRMTNQDGLLHPQSLQQTFSISGACLQQQTSLLRSKVGWTKQLFRLLLDDQPQKE